MSPGDRSPGEPDPATGLRDALLQVMRADLEADRLRSAAEYRALYPGHEGEISALLALLEDGPIGGGRVAADGAGAPAVPDEHGERVGPYRILDEIGRGGQAIVYLAEHVELARRVALKVLQRGAVELQASADRHRFRREAEVTSRLDHFGICSVYEAGEDGGQAWIAMRHVPGETLAAHLERCHEDDEPPPSGVVSLPAPSESGDRPPPGTQAGAKRQRPQSPPPQAGDWLMRVVALIEKVARALHFAHERGLVHRDVKPANIMVDPGGEPVLLDFGMAKDETAGGATLTIKGDLIGTPYYMSPEQLLAQRVPLDRRTDVYSLGATLYECLTLRRPYDATSREALYQQILAGDLPDPRGLNPRIPRDLALVLQTALDRDRDRRYQTALDLAEDLRRVRTHELIRARPLPRLLRARRWGQRHPALATALGALVVGLVVASWLLVERSERLRQSWALNLLAAAEQVVPEDPELALRLALRAVELEDSVATRAQVQRVLCEPFPALGLELPDGIRASWFEFAGWSADGTRLCAAGREPDRALYAVWDRSGKLQTLVRRPDSSSQSVAERAGFQAMSARADRFVYRTENELEFLDDAGRVLNVVPKSSWIRLGELWFLSLPDGSCESRNFSGELVAAVAPVDSPVIALSAARSDDEFVLATRLGTLELRDRNGELVRRCRLGQEPGEADMVRLWARLGDSRTGRMAFSERTRRAALRLGSGGVVLWDVDSGRIWQLDCDEPCRQLQFSPPGDRLMTIHGDAARLWTEDGELIARLDPPGSAARLPERAWGLEWFSPRGDRLITLYTDQSVALWDCQGRSIGWLDLDVGTGFGGWHYSKRQDLLIAFNGGQLRVFDFEGRYVEHLGLYRGRGGSGWVQFELSPDGRHVLAISFRGQAWMSSLPGATSSRTLAHTGAIRGLAVAIDGRMATASDDGTARIWAAEGVEAVSETIGHEQGGFRSIALSRDGELVCLGDNVGVVRLLNTNTRREVHTWRFRRARVLGVAISLDGGMVAASSATSGDSRVWRCQDGREVVRVDGSVRSLRFSQDGRRLYATGWGVRLLSIPIEPDPGANPLTGETIPGSESDVACLDVRVTPDESMLVASYADGVIRFWRRIGAQWSLAWERHEHRRNVVSVAFSLDSTRLLSASRDGTARIWDLNGNTLSILRGRGAPLRAAEFTPDGKQVITADEEGILGRFFADSDAMLQHARSIRLRDVTEDEQREYGELLGR